MLDKELVTIIDDRRKLINNQKPLGSPELTRSSYINESLKTNILDPIDELLDNQIKAEILALEHEKQIALLRHSRKEWTKEAYDKVMLAIEKKLNQKKKFLLSEV